MTQTLQEQDSQSFDLDHYIGIARRRHLHFLMPLFVGWLSVWGLSWVLPARYRSGTLILVEQPTITKDYVTPNVNEDLQERLQSLTQQILSRTRLLHVIEQMNLYAGEHTHLTPDEQVEHMRKNIEIGLVRDAQNHVTAFNVYYSAPDPRIAQRVTSELTNLFISENLEVRKQQSEGTTKFLEAQLETARQALTTQEEKIREFKGQHLGELPTQLSSNLQILGGLQSQLHNEEDALNSADQQHVYLQTLLNQYRIKSPEGAPMGLPALNQELEKLKSELADLHSRYTDHHPDVRKLKDQIAETEKMRDQLVASLNSAHNIPGTDEAATSSQVDGVDSSQASPAAQLESQLRANQIEIENRKEAIASLKAKVSDYQARLDQEPVREQQLADLTRGYDQSKAIYDELLKKNNESAMATSMELLQQGERFRIIDPPSLPVKPEFPNRLKFCGMGIAFGLVLGIGVVGAFEMLDDRLYEEKQLEEILPMPVLLEIPIVTDASDEQKSKRTLWFGWATAVLVVITMAAGSAFSFFLG
jgi:polysaccharide biosynthesis transport protein